MMASLKILNTLVCIPSSALGQKLVISSSAMQPPGLDHHPLPFELLMWHSCPDRYNLICQWFL
jgi:hypothetical protein